MREEGYASILEADRNIFDSLLDKIGKTNVLIERRSYLELKIIISVSL